MACESGETLGGRFGFGATLDNEFVLGADLEGPGPEGASVGPRGDSPGARDGCAPGVAGLAAESVPGLVAGLAAGVFALSFDLSRSSASALVNLASKASPSASVSRCDFENFI